MGKEFEQNCAQELNEDISAVLLYASWIAQDRFVDFERAS
jgi:hypothetical protein